MVGSGRSSLRRSLLIGAAAACAGALAPAAVHAAGLSPDPAPAVTLRPDPYPDRTPAVAPPTPPRAVVRAAVAPPPSRPITTPTRPVQHRRQQPRPAHVERRPAVRLPFPTLAIKWFSGVTAPAEEARREVPRRIALLLAALVLASAVFVAGAAQEAAR